MNESRKTRFLLLAILIAAAVLIALRSLVMDYIIYPAALLLWGAWRIIASVDQNIYWIILIVACGLLVVRFIARRRRTLPRSAYQEPYRSPSRYEYWQSTIEESTLGKHEAKDLDRSLIELGTALTEHTEKTGGMNAVEDSPVLDASLPVGKGQSRLPMPNAVERVSNSDPIRDSLILPRWLKRWIGKISPRDYSQIEEILTWMETELEIKHED